LPAEALLNARTVVDDGLIVKTARLSKRPATVLAAVLVSMTLGCSSSSSGLACGDGTVEKGSQCIAAAVDASVDGASPARTDAGGAPDATAMTLPDAAIVEPPVAPTFAGVTAVAPISPSALLVVWSPGSMPGDPTAALRYRIYEGTSASPIAYATPLLQTAVGAVSTVVGGLSANATYTFGARAVNAAGIADANTVQKTGRTAKDTSAPVFGGIKTAGPGTGGAVAVSWDAATDDLTPAPAMTYLVYTSDKAGAEDFDTPALITDPGALSASVTRLPDATKARFFVVRARDAAGNVDTNTRELSAKPATDVTPPAFGGCTAATTMQAITIGITWNAATDDVSAPAHMTYDIFESTSAGTFDFTKPFATVNGANTVVIPALMTSTTYYFVCRAKDEAGNEDDNTAEVSATTGADPVPPMFAGIDLPSFNGDPAARTATLSWLAAVDAATSPDKMVYDVYESQTMGGEDFTKPPAATSMPGALTITLANLPPNATVYFVVRARDLDGNHDSNVVEASLSTNVSFALNVQPIFSDDCGVVGCHVPGSPTGGLILAAGFSYAQLVNVAAPEAPTLNLVTPTDPTDSFLAVKINYNGLFSTKGKGSLMPAPSTGSTLSPGEINTIANWIAQGAVNN
jgi:hypothetical protein